MAQKAPTPVRLPDELLYKIEVVAKHHRRKRGEFLRMLAEDAVAAHEKAHGAIPYPPASAASSH